MELAIEAIGPEPLCISDNPRHLQQRHRQAIPLLRRGNLGDKHFPDQMEPTSRGGRIETDAMEIVEKKRLARPPRPRLAAGAVGRQAVVAAQSGAAEADQSYPFV